ncbi:MAG: membrane protein insertion efficiency factor YidD [Candidatus Aminicenantes bacterium]|nr:membrane protein insertion efficiency factor YidD [Candidatus Aminicenantes bacterium]
MKRIVLFLIKAYKMLMSPLVGRHCRFAPTCSDYTYQAIEKFGILRGVYLGMRRILKCHPFHEGGFDPVP